MADTRPPYPERAPLPENCVKRLLLVRHGETELNRTGVLQGSGVDAELNATGTRQARALARRFAETKIDLVVASTLTRAQQTAGEVRAVLPQSVPYIEDVDLCEISWGEWEGLLNPDLTELMKAWDEWDFDACAPGGEAPRHVEERAVGALERIICDSPDKNVVLVVVHGRLLRILLSSLLHCSLHEMQNYKHRNTCVNIVDIFEVGGSPPGALPSESDLERARAHAPEPQSSVRLRSRLMKYRFTPVALDSVIHLEECGLPVGENPT